MSEAAGLERGYRRLLAWYPRPYRSGHEEEMLAVLMAGAQDGQRRPGVMESLDLLRGALTMRLRRPPAGEVRGWADSLAVFSVATPLFLLVLDALIVALPYHLTLRNRNPLLVQIVGRHPEVGGVSLLGVPFFGIAVGCQAVVAILILLGLRRTALIAMVASAIFWGVARDSIPWIPYPLQLLTTSGYILTAAALIASPGPRRGRQLLSWRHGAVLLLAAGAVQAATLMLDASRPIAQMAALGPPETKVYLVVSIVLAAAAVVSAVALRLNRVFLLLLAVMFYPCAMELAFATTATGSGGDLLGNPTPARLALLFAPPLLLACGAVIGAVLPRRPGGGAAAAAAPSRGPTASA